MVILIHWIQSDNYNIDHVCNSAAGPVYGFHIFIIDNIYFSDNHRPVSVIGGDVNVTEDGEVTIPLDDDVDEVRIES